MTDNTTVNDEELEKQKEQFLNVLWNNEFAGIMQPYYRKEHNPEEATNRNLSKSSILPQVYQAPDGLTMSTHFLQGDIWRETNPLVDMESLPDFYSSAEDKATIDLIRKAITKTNNADPKPKNIQEWAAALQQNVNNTQLGLANSYLVSNVYNFASEANVVNMFGEPEPELPTGKQADRIKSWLNSVNLGDKYDDYMKKYAVGENGSLEQAYAVIQNAMAKPTNTAKLLGISKIKSREIIEELINEKADYEKIKQLKILKAEAKEKTEEEPLKPMPIDSKMAGLDMNIKSADEKEAKNIQTINIDYGLGREKSDMIKLASSVRTTLKLEGYGEKRIQRACDKAFNKCKDNGFNGNLTDWAVTYASELINQLDMTNATDSDYKNIATQVESIVDKINKNIDVGPINPQYLNDINQTKSKTALQNIKDVLSNEVEIAVENKGLGIEGKATENNDVKTPIDMGSFVTFTDASKNKDEKPQKEETQKVETSTVETPVIQPLEAATTETKQNEEENLPTPPKKNKIKFFDLFKRKDKASKEDDAEAQAKKEAKEAKKEKVADKPVSTPSNTEEKELTSEEKRLIDQSLANNAKKIDYASALSGIELDEKIVSKRDWELACLKTFNDNMRIKNNSSLNFDEWVDKFTKEAVERLQILSGVSDDKFKGISEAIYNSKNEFVSRIENGEDLGADIKRYTDIANSQIERQNSEMDKDALKKYLKEQSIEAQKGYYTSTSAKSDAAKAFDLSVDARDLKNRLDIGNIRNNNDVTHKKDEPTNTSEETFEIVPIASRTPHGGASR